MCFTQFLIFADDEITILDSMVFKNLVVIQIKRAVLINYIYLLTVVFVSKLFLGELGTE